jgi:hypothetical protein
MTCSCLSLNITIAQMEAHQLQQRHWYWIRRKDGSLAPYVFHQTRHDDEGKIVADFFVGSFLVPFGLNQIEGEATMPKMADDK